MKNDDKNAEADVIASKDGLDRDLKSEIFISVRIEHLRKTVEEVKGDVMPEDIIARDEILESLKIQGYEVLSVGEGSYACAWVKKNPENNAELFAAQERLMAKRRSLGIAV